MKTELNLRKTVQDIISSERYDMYSILDEDMLAEDLRADGWNNVSVSMGLAYAEKEGRKFCVNLDTIEWKRTRQPQMATKEVTEQAVENRAEIEAVVAELRRGELSYAQAKKKAQPAIDRINERAIALAKQFGTSAKLLSFAEVAR